MTLKELLKTTTSRVSFRNKWLVWEDADFLRENNNPNGKWYVFERKYGARKNIVHYEGIDLTEAITVLIREE